MSAALSVGLLAGCSTVSDAVDTLTGRGGSESDPLEAVDFTTPATPVWVADITPAGTPAYIGDTVLVYDGASDLTIRSLDADTGEELWSAPASTGAVNPDRVLVPTVTTTGDGRVLVAYLQPPVLDEDIDYYEHTLIVADARTGEQVMATEPAWTSSVANCRFTKEICYSTFDNSTQSFVMQAYDPGSGEVAPYVSPVGDGAEVEELAEGVFSYTLPDEAKTAVIGRYSGGEILWEKEASYVIGENLSTVKHIRASRVDEATQSMVLSVARPEIPNDQPFTLTPADIVTAAFDLETGNALWSVADHIATCVDGPAMLCSGGLVLNRVLGSGHVLLEAADVAMTKVDPLTGEPVWRTELAGLEAFGNASVQPTIASSGETFVFRQDGAYRLLRDSDGEVVDLADDALVACSTPTDFRGPALSNPMEQPVVFNGSSRWRACSAATDVPVTDPSQFSVGVVLSAGMSPDKTSTSSLTILQATEAIAAYEPTDVP
jgi:outer membrane protein assembly factor BamB